MLGYDVFTQLEFLLRIFVAGVCGALIGYERKSRLKEAGIRTHFIVALASALLMVISKYCYTDVINGTSIRLDPSRVTSTIVSGVGFLGAGMIFVRRQTINGLTTAAGIWATAGVGMAIGGGFYFIGIASTAIILFVQVVLHKNVWLVRKIPEHENIRFVIVNKTDVINKIKESFKLHEMEVISVHMETSESGNSITMDMDVKIPRQCDHIELASEFSKIDGVKSLDM